MVLDNKENSVKCTCPNCPSYNECMSQKTELLYCAKEKTSCEVKSDGCVCPTCPVYAENDLNRMYYCRTGK
ncbi:MAG: DUF2769 domain-containing protein [Candidatus Parcubacteria bacterium]|nr:DUF2769 domain-containing protein [Candidatus Parcubacteria bacterium]